MTLGQIFNKEARQVWKVSMYSMVISGSSTELNMILIDFNPSLEVGIDQTGAVGGA